MIYGPSNVEPTCWVVLVGTGKVRNCVSVDTARATATFYEEPFVVENDEFQAFTCQYSAIHPVFAGSPWPAMLLIFP